MTSLYFLIIILLSIVAILRVVDCKYKQDFAELHESNEYLMDFVADMNDDMLKVGKALSSLQVHNHESGICPVCKESDLVEQFNKIHVDGKILMNYWCGYCSTMFSAPIDEKELKNESN